MMAAVRSISACSSLNVQLFSEGVPSAVSVEMAISAVASGCLLAQRSTALWQRLVSPPINQFAKGGLL